MPFQKTFLRVLASALVLASTSEVFAWGDIGHGAVGYIAEKNLTPAAVAMVYAIVGSEPLPVSAVFPDQVRSDDRFKPFGGFHFFEIPPGFSYETLPDSRRAERDAHTIIEQVPGLLTSRSLNHQQRMILYRYLIHVAGDIHQPLHIGNGVDMGANLCDVKWLNPETNQVKTLVLHAVWDEALIQNIGAIFKKEVKEQTGKEPWFGYRELGDIILKESGEAEVARLKNDVKLDFGPWYNESQALHAAAYPDATPVAKPSDRAYCKMVDPTTNKVVNGNYDATKIPTLSADYVTKSLPIVKRQILLGGLRLAAILNKAAENYKIPKRWEGKKPSVDLAGVLLKNKPRAEARQPQNKSSKKLKPEPVQWRAQFPYPEEH